MSFTVIWRAAAEEELAELWLSAADRNAVSNAVDEIDAMLQRDPLTAGESRSGKFRIVIVPPVAVHFRVREQSRKVSVVHIRRWGRPK